MQDLASRHSGYSGTVTTHGSVLDGTVVEDFIARESEMKVVASAIRDGVRSGSLVDSYVQLHDVDDGDDDSAPEGHLLVRRHLTRERDRRLRQRKIAKHLKPLATLACETCGFDFEAVYGAHGAGYIECHHVVPLHESGETKTKLDDLILICATATG